MKKVRLVGVDVDGTLVGRGGVVHPAVWEAAAEARACGVRIALCSGRPAFGVAREYAARLDAGGWHIFQNGASVLHLSRGESRSAPLPVEALAPMIDESRRLERVLELYSDADYAVERPQEAARAHAALLGLPFVARPFSSLRGEVVRAQWLVLHKEAEAIWRAPHPGLSVAFSTSPVMPETTFVMFTRAGVNKGSALRAVAEAYGIPLEAVMMVGDSHNDLDALRVAGVPVAMGNAEPEVKAAARDVVGSVEEGGLAEALLRAARG